MDPIARFTELLERARKTPAIAEPTGMTLSTVGADGRPSARIVLLKGVDSDGLVFFLGAWASEQSAPLRAREDLEKRFAELERKYEGKDIPRPPHWSGYRVAPLVVEFWQNRPARLHQREVYTRKAPGAPWTMTLLNP